MKYIKQNINIIYSVILAGSIMLFVVVKVKEINKNTVSITPMEQTKVFTDELKFNLLKDKEAQIDAHKKIIKSMVESKEKLIDIDRQLGYIKIMQNIIKRVKVKPVEKQNYIL